MKRTPAARAIFVILVGLIVVIALGVIGFFGFRLWFRGYLQTEAARQQVNHALSTALQAQVEVEPLQVQTLDSIYSDRLTAGRQGEPFLRADQLRADVRFNFLARTCEIDLLDITRLQLVYRATPAQTHQTAEAAEDGDAPPHVRLGRAVVGDFGVQWPGGQLAGSRLEARPGGNGEWLLHGEGGDLAFAIMSGGKAWRISDFDVRLRPGGEIILSRSAIRIGEKGELSLQGESVPGGKSHWQATYAAIPVRELADGDWRARLDGTLSGLLLLEGAGERELRIARGTVELHDGELTALPLLDTLAKVTRMDGFRRLRLHTGRAKVASVEEGGVRFSEIEIESSGLVRIEGDLIIHDGEVRGTIALGVAPGSLRWLPGGREVFTGERGGYLWTPVRLSGSAASPTEDLSPRLARAALEHGAQETRKVIEKTGEGVIDAVAPLIPLLPIP